MVNRILYMFLALLLCAPAYALELDSNSDDLIDAVYVDAYTQDAVDTLLLTKQEALSEYSQAVAEALTSQDLGLMTPLRTSQAIAAYLKDNYGYGTALSADPQSGEWVGQIAFFGGYTASYDPASQHDDGYDGAYWAVCTQTGTPGTWKATLRIDGTVPYTGTQYKTWVFDPAAICNGTFDGLALITANGATTVEGWKITFIDADPTTEITNIALKRADSHPARSNNASMDTLTTVNGVASELTEANINSGTAVADGKVIYLEFATPYTETGHQVKLELWFRNE